MTRKDFEEVINCNLCGSKKTKLFLNAPDRNYQTGQYTYVTCQECQLVWLSPRPNKKAIYKYYPNIYRAYQPTPEVSLLKQRIRSVIYRWPLLNQFLIKDKLFFMKKKGKLLDVGMGSGNYLHVLKGWGWQVYGNEPNQKAFEIAKTSGLTDITNYDFLKNHYPPNSFDLVRFSHVVEHVPSPSEYLIETGRILNNNGRIIIYIPNINSLFFKIFKSYWYPLDPPRHLFHFSPKNIRALLKKTGFRNIEISYEQSPYTFIRSLLYKFGSKRVESRYGIVVYPLSVFLKAFNVLKLSDTMVIIATKG